MSASTMRALRGGRLQRSFLILGLVIGVAALVVVRGFCDGVRDGIAAQAREILSADLVIDSRRQLSEEAEAFFGAREGVQTTRLTELSSMVRRPDSAPVAGEALARKSLLAELRVVKGQYPLIGTIALSPEAPLEQLLTKDQCVVASELLERLQLKVGDGLKVGRATLLIAGEVLREPSRIDLQLVEGPRVYLSEEAFATTGLLTFGSRVGFKRLYRFEPRKSLRELADEAKAFEREIADSPYMRIRTPDNAQPSLEQGLGRVSSFLGLIALAALLLSGLGVAQITRAFIAERTRDVAILRCLGTRPKEILAGALQRILVTAAIGSLGGVLLATLLLFVLPRVLPASLPSDWIRPIQPMASILGFGLGVLIAVLFSLLPLLAIWRVSPALVLRNEARPLQVPRLFVLSAALSLALGVLFSAYVVTESWPQALSFSGGGAAVVLLLSLAARGLSWLVRRLSRGPLPAAIWHGIAALGRPGAGTLGALVAIGFGVMVVFGLWAVESRLRAGLLGTLPEDAPSAFLLDIQPAQWEPVQEVLRGLEATRVESAPLVTGRLAQINERKVQEIASERKDGQRGRWVLTREQRLSTRQELPPDNRLLEALESKGAAKDLWRLKGEDEVSIEAGYARDLGVKLGDLLHLDVQGVLIALRISTIREVDWQRFGINFFLIVEPGVIDQIPGFRLATVRVPLAREGELRERMASGFPNVSVIGIREVVDQVLGLLSRVALAVRVLGAFTVLVGLVILVGAVTAGALKRQREVALWKALGIGRRTIATFFAIEFGLIGLIAGGLGGGAALLLSDLFVSEVLRLATPPPYGAFPVVLIASALGCAGAGLLASGKALRTPPLVALRGDL